MAWDSNDKAEMRKLTTKLGAAYSEGCFRHNNPKDCHHLAHFMETVTENLQKAAMIFRKTCDDLHYGPSCQKFASLVRRGVADVDDPVVSVRYDRKGCELGRAKSCFYAAVAMLNDRQRGQIDVPLAVSLLERGCDLGCHNSCYLVGGLYLNGVPDVMDKNVSTTYKYDFKACQLGNKLACANLRGALPLTENGRSKDDPLSNGFVLRMMQLKVMNERSKNT